MGLLKIDMNSNQKYIITVDFTIIFLRKYLDHLKVYSGLYLMVKKK